MVVRPSRRSESGREARSEVRVALQEVRECSGGPPGSPVVVGRPSRRAEIPSRRSESGRKFVSKDREWSGGHPGGPGVVGRPFWWSGS